VEKQLQLVGQTSIDSGNLQWILRYRAVGDRYAVNQFLVDPICNQYGNLYCEFQGHDDKGHEETTLQQLHDFCRENPDETVVYVHSKGSLHDH
jgi:hypothetical protein